MNMNDKSEAMRMMLFNAGIVLDSEKPKHKPVASTAAPAIDRGEIRRILIANGAPEKDLRWMTMSCPSLEHARAYRPTVVIDSAEKIDHVFVEGEV